MSTSHRTLAWVAASYLALTVLLTWPFATGLATHVLSTGTDMDLAVWTIGWDVHSFTHQPWHIFDANIFYPWTNTLAYSENLIGSALLAAPVVWTTGNVVLGMNTAVLLSVAISAFGAFLLARQLGLSVGASFLAGLVAAFAPPRFFRMEQLPISSVQWIPFALAALHRYFDTADLSQVSPAMLEAGIDRLRVDFGLETDHSRRFALWSLLYMLGHAPDLEVAFKEEADREAARNLMDLLAASGGD